jgi:uncharacterized LabA/DUF88 family protein
MTSVNCRLRVLVLIDEANLLGVSRQFDRRLDWDALRNFLADPADGRELVECVVYAGLPPAMPGYTEARDRKSKFLHWLRAHGFLVVVKDGSPTEGGRYKANVDVLMAIDGLDLALEGRPDVVVLVTGDSDFAHLAVKLRRRGIRVEVAAIGQTLGNELRTSANGCIDLTELFNRLDPLHGGADAIGGVDVFDTN